METRISNFLKLIIDQLMCYKAQFTKSADVDIQGIINEKIQELKTDCSLPTAEEIEIQKVPPSKKKKVPLTDRDTKPTLETAHDTETRNETSEEFLRELCEITRTGDYSEALSIYFTRKQRMNQALWQAIENNQPEICKLLLSRKNYGDLVAQTNARGPNEEISLHIAARLGNLKICEILLEYGELTEVNAKDADGCSPLHLACKFGHYLTAQFLIRSGTLLNSTDDKLNTPMHYAALNGEKKLIKYLFTKFTNANIKNEDGKTPLDILKEQKINIEDLENLEGLGISKSLYSKSSDSIEIISEIAPSFSFRDFEAIQILGRGSFGEVFLVEMRSNGQKFAIKVLRKDKIVGQNLVKYAMAERNVLSYIHHPFIVGLNFAFQSTEKLYLVLDYCPGGNLTSYIIRQRFFSESIAKFYLCELILALEELHRHGIIYRDLKPDNVVIDSEGHALLTDFGLSKEGIIDNVSAKSFCGSVAYLAPEILKRKGHGKAVDWYLLGVLFYEMLVGVPPFYSNSKEQLFFNIEFKKPLIPSRISSSAESLLRKLLKKVPEKRIGFKSGAEEIKNHEFFNDVDWEIVLRKDITPPLKPIIMMVPGYIPRNHMMEDLSLEPDTRHLNGWTFINSS